MVPERYWRFISAPVRARVATLARVDDDAWMQDWPLEVSAPARVAEFVALVQTAADPDDRHALMSLVLASLDDAAPEVQDAIWPTVATLLEREPLLHAGSIIYWSVGACDDDHDTGGGSVWRLERDEDSSFALTPRMRQVLYRVRDAIGFRELEPVRG